LNLVVASHVDNFLLLGVLVGCITLIFVQKRIKDDIVTMHYAALITGFISISIIFYPYMPLWVIEVTLFLIGLFSPVYLLNFKVCALLLPDSLRASSTGFTNMMMVAIAPVFQLIFAGFVMTAAHFIRYFHAEQMSMALFPVLTFIAAFLVLRIKIPKNRPLR